MKKPSLLLALAGIAASATIVTAADARPVYIASESTRVAVSGHDAVSYFRGNGVPRMGNPAFAVRYGGADYHFASADNAAAFKANPTAFAPQYGGHCAWAMGRGYLAPGDPTQYSVVDGKLYLNFNADVKAMWGKDISGFIKKGDTNWPTFPDDAKFGG